MLKKEESKIKIKNIEKKKENLGSLVKNCLLPGSLIGRRCDHPQNLQNLSLTISRKLIPVYEPLNIL